MAARSLMKHLAFALSVASVQLLFAQSAEPTKTVVPVSISPLQGSITIGETVYSRTSSSGIQMLLLSRQPNSRNLGAPDLIANQTFTDPESANTFLASQLQNTPDALLIVSSSGNYGFPLSALDLKNFGSSHELQTASGSPPLVFIGNGGLNEGNAHEKFWGSTNDTNGYLATDSNSNYTFIQTDYIKYDIRLDGTIQIGSNIYTVANARNACKSDDQEGFHVVAVYRETLEYRWESTYCTDDPFSGDGELNRLAGDLNLLLTDVKDDGGNVENVLVFIASFGLPIPSDWKFGDSGDPRIQPVAAAIAELGGYWETFAELTPNDTYTLVGAAPPPAGTPHPRHRARESSTLYPGPSTNHDHATGELHGVLARGLRGNWYSPLNADPSGQANLGFYEVLAQSASFPHPTNNQELQAFNSISSQLCGSGCNARNQYGDLNVSIPDYLNSLSQLKPPGGGSCSSNPGMPFCIMQQQLSTELNYVADIRNFNSNMQRLWLGSGTDSIYELLTTWNKLQDALNPPPAAPTPNLVDPIVSFFLSVASYIPEIGPLFGVADAAFNLGTSLTTDPQGNPAVNLTSTVANVSQQAITLFNQQATTTGTQFALIYQDWGRLSVLGANLGGAQPGSPWYWGPSTTGQVLTAMQPAIEASYYESFLAATYSIGSYIPCGWYNQPGYPNQYCEQQIGGSYGTLPLYNQPLSYGVYSSSHFDGVAQAFSNPPYLPWTYPADPDNPANTPASGSATIIANGGWLGIGLQSTPRDPGPGEYQPAPQATLSHLFTPYSQGGLGIYRPAFFEGWSFPHLVCDFSFAEDSPGLGCDWGSGSPAAESLPSHLTKITLGIGHPKETREVQGQFNVRLTLRNSGTIDVRSIHIDRVRLRTLAGSGEAVLLGVLSPKELGRIAPGDFQSFTVRINIPSGVKKLAVYADGDVDTGGKERPKFSIGEVIFPGGQ